MMKLTRYEMIWRNKWITSHAKSIDDMISAFNASIKELQDIKKDGIEVDFSGAGDDYIFMYTADSVLAKKYSMNESEEDNDCDDECECYQSEDHN